MPKMKTTTKKRRDKTLYSEKLLNTMGVFVSKKGGKVVLHIPLHLEKEAKKLYEFSFDMLSLGGDLSLAELADALNEQATLEGRFAYLAELALYYHESLELECEEWYSEKHGKIKDSLNKPTTKDIECAVMKTYKKYGKYKRQILEAKMKYRILSHAIHAAVVTRGKMFQSLRNILQPEQMGFSTDIKGGNIKV